MLGAKHRFTNLANPLRGVRKIQNACGVGRLKINEALNPFRSITHTRNLLSGFEVSAATLGDPSTDLAAV